MPELICRLQRVRTIPQLAIVSLSGSIDPRNLSTLEAALSTSNGQGFRSLILDLADIRYVNSAGLAYLVNLSDVLALRGGALHLANPQPKVKVVFDLMGVSQFFKIHKSVDAALKGFKRSESLQRPPREC